MGYLVNTGSVDTVSGGQQWEDSDLPRKLLREEPEGL